MLCSCGFSFPQVARVPFDALVFELREHVVDENCGIAVLARAPVEGHHFHLHSSQFKSTLQAIEVCAYSYFLGTPLFGFGVGPR